MVKKGIQKTEIAALWIFQPARRKKKIKFQKDTVVGAILSISDVTMTVIKVASLLHFVH